MKQRDPASLARALSGGGVTLRVQRESDAAFLRRLYRTTRADELAAAGITGEGARAFCDQQFDAQHRDWRGRYPDAARLIIMRGGAPVGRFYLDPAVDPVRIIDISLLPVARGQGFGGQLIAALARHLRGRALALAVDPFNIRAHALYTRLGFVETARDETRIQMVRAPDP